MKILTLTLLLCLTGTIYAQNLKKNDSIVAVDNGLKLAYKKSKVAIYFGEERFQKPSKNLFIIDDIHALVFEVDLKKNEVYGISASEGQPKKVLLSEGLNQNLDSSRLVLLNPAWKDTTFYIHEQIEFQIKEELVYYFFQNRLSRNTTNNIYHAGLYAKDLEAYVFQSKTQPLYNIENRYFTAFSGVNDTCFVQMHWINGNLDVENECLQHLNEEEFAKILEVDKVQQIGETNFYYTFHKGKWGLVYLEMYNYLNQVAEPVGKSEIEIITEQYANFEFNVEEPAVYDYLYHSLLWGQYITFNEGQMVWKSNSAYSRQSFAKEFEQHFSTFTTNYEVFHIEVDGVDHTYDTSANYEMMTVMNGGFGCTRINDSLILINDYTNDEEIAIYDETGYMMYDENGNLVMKKIVGEKKSGLYNMKRQQWTLKQVHPYISYFGGTLLNTTIIDSAGNLESNYYNLEGTKKSFDLTNSEEELDFMNATFSLKDETVTIANTDYYNNRFYKSDNFNELLFFDGKAYRHVPVMECIRSNKSPKKERFSFIHPSMNSNTLTDMNYKFVEQKDTLKFLMSCKGTKSEIVLKDQDFSLKVEDFLGESYSAYAFFVTVNYKDTTEYFWLNDFFSLEQTTVENYKNPIADLSESMSVTKRGKILVVNSSEFIEEISWADPDVFWGDEAQQSKSWEIEGSSIWQKNDSGVWKQVSDDYAQIMSTPFGYIAKTGSFENNWVDEETREMNYENHKAYFELLDEKGLKINVTEDTLTDCTVLKENQFYSFEVKGLNKKKLIDESGNFVTNDSFDFFRLEGDDVFGIDREMYDIDEFGYEKYDEEGNPVLLQKARKVKLN